MLHLLFFAVLLYLTLKVLRLRGRIWDRDRGSDISGDSVNAKSDIIT